MYKILFDDILYKNIIEQSVYFGTLIDIISLYFDAEIVCFLPFGEKQRSNSLAMGLQNINKKIHKTQKQKKYNLNEVNDVSDNELEQLGFSKNFIGKIYYVKETNPNDVIIVPLAYNKTNRILHTKNTGTYLFYIGNYDEEVESNISKWINSNDLIHVEEPNFNDKFPAMNLCNGYDKWRSEILQPQYTGDKISDFTKIGLEVALRNHYIYDSKLTALNKAKSKRDKNGNAPKRQIFTNRKKDVYLSVDFENGGFEVYDKNAHHQGQFRFNGKFEKAPNDKSHPLYLK